MKKKFQQKDNPLIKPFNKNEAITCYRFAQICGCSHPAITKAINAERLFLNPDGTITPGHIMNQLFMQKQIIKNMAKSGPEGMRYRQSVLTSLLTDTPISGEAPKPEPFDFKKLKEDAVYNIGVIDDGLFIPLITVFKSENQSQEISVLKNNISIGMQKGVITDLYMNNNNVGKLFYIPA
mgnify:CR=1 FL=1